MRNWYLTVVGLVLITTFYILSFVFNLDLSERLARSVARMEDFEIDELLLAFAVLLAIECMRAHRRSARIYKATAGAAQHVLGNCLQGLQMIDTRARHSGDIPPDIVDFCERMSTEATSQLKALSTVQKVDERIIWRAVAPDSNHVAQ